MTGKARLRRELWHAFLVHLEAIFKHFEDKMRERKPYGE